MYDSGKARGSIVWYHSRMQTFDYKKQLKEFYGASKIKPVIVDVPAFPFLLIDGTGDPSTSTRFQEAVGTLYPVSYKLKFVIKRQREIDYKVMPLTGFWTLADPSGDSMDRDNWAWVLGIQQPDFVTEADIEAALAATKGKKPAALLGELCFEKVSDGLCAQILHVGPFDTEQATFAIMDAFVERAGYEYAAHGHREIYLSDFTKTAPERLRTVLRKKIQAGPAP